MQRCNEVRRLLSRSKIGQGSRGHGATPSCSQQVCFQPNAFTPLMQKDHPTASEPCLCSPWGGQSSHDEPEYSVFSVSCRTLTAPTDWHRLLCQWNWLRDTLGRRKSVASCSQWWSSHRFRHGLDVTYRCFRARCPEESRVLLSSCTLRLVSHHLVQLLHFWLFPQGCLQAIKECWV